MMHVITEVTGRCPGKSGEGVETQMGESFSKKSHLESGNKIKMLKEARSKRVDNAQFCLFKVQEQAKLICGDRN